MKRTTISLPDRLAAAVEREAKRRRVPVSQIAREALEARLGVADERRSLAIAGLGKSGHRDTARNVEEILEAEWADDARSR